MSIRQKRSGWVIVRLLLLLTVDLLLLSAFPLSLRASTGDAYKVLILHSSEPDFPRTMDQMAGIKDVFSASGERIQYNVEYLDTKRYHKQEYFSDILVRVFDYKLKDRTFDLVLLSDDDALEFVLNHRDRWFSGVPIVFCGVSDFNLLRVSCAEEITGVSNVPSFRNTIELALRFHPSSKELIFIGCPKNLPGKLARDGIDATFPEFRARVNFTFWDGLHAKELAIKLRSLHDGQLAFIYGSICDQSNRVLSAEELGETICGNSPVPVYSFWDYLLGQGIVGGNLVSSKKQGALGGDLALRVLRGEPPENIPVVRVDSNPNMFDYAQLKKFNIPIASLPADSIVINQPEPFYHVSKEYLWGALGLMMAMGITTLILVTNIRKRQRVEKELIRRQAFEELISNISTRFIDSGLEKDSRSIDFTLQALGVFTRVDRCYVYWMFPDGAVLDPAHEWDAPGLASPDASLQEMAVHELSLVVKQLSRLETIYVPEVGVLSVEYEIEKKYWMQRDVLSVVVVPITRNGELAGALGFESVRAKKLWNEDDFVLLRTVAEILGNAFERQLYEHRLQLSLQEAETARDKIDAILSSVADGLIVTDTENRVVLINKAAEKLLEVDSQHRLLRPVADLIREPVFNERLATLGATADSSFQVLLQLFDREKEEVRAIQARTSIVLGQDGSARGAVTILRDVTREQEIDRMKSEFIAITAHELRTPLASILGYAELLFNEGDIGPINDDQRREFVSYILKKAEALEHIIDDLLDVGRIETGRQILLEKSPLEILTLIREVMSHYRLETSRHDLELQTDEESVVVEMDERKLTQVLDNLLSNAVKYSPAGGKIRIGCRSEEGWVRVFVDDEGIGMSPEQLGRVFDKFYRADTSNTAVGGLGLGMGIVKGIIEAHGGRIFVESQRGKGTRVSFVLPKRVPTHEQDS